MFKSRRLLPVTRVSRHALPHAARLRGRGDLGPVGALALVAGIVGVLVADRALAGESPVNSLRVEETADLDVLLTVDARDAPTFQVFHVPGRGSSYVVELPGLALDHVGLESTGTHILLDDAHVEPAQKGGPGRVVLAFADDVDYNANTKGGELFIRFTHAGDKKALIQAHDKKVADLELKRVALAEQKRRVDEDAKVKGDAESARLAALEKRRADEESARKSAIEARLRADADKRAALERQRLEDEAKKAALAEEKRRADEEKKAAAERRRLEIEAKKQAELEAKRQAAEKKRLEEEARKQAELEARQKAEEAKKQAELEAQRKAEEEQRAAAEKKRLEDEARKQAELEARQKAEAEAKRKALEAERMRVEAENQRKAAEAKAKAEDEARRLDAERAEQARAAAEAQKKAEAEARRLEEARQQQALADQRAADERARVEAERVAAEKAARGEQDRLRVEAQRAEAQRLEEQKKLTEARRLDGVRPPRTTAAVSSIKERSQDYGFGGKSIDLTRPTRYERYVPPANDEDDFGGGNDDDEVVENTGRSVLSQVTVQRAGSGSRVGVHVDGGGKYNITRRGKTQVVLTLFDTRAANLEVRRILDAASLQTSVLRVLPTVEEDQRFRVDLVIELREPAPVKIGQENGMLWLSVGDG